MTGVWMLWKEKKILEHDEEEKKQIENIYAHVHTHLIRRNSSKDDFFDIQKKTKKSHSGTKKKKKEEPKPSREVKQRGKVDMEYLRFQENIEAFKLLERYERRRTSTPICEYIDGGDERDNEGRNMGYRGINDSRDDEMLFHFDLNDEGDGDEAGVDGGGGGVVIKRHMKSEKNEEEKSTMEKIFIKLSRWKTRYEALYGINMKRTDFQETGLNASTLNS